MDQEKLIQVSFQIPPSALDSLSRLAEQLRLLTETVHASELPNSRSVETERMESGSFDPERFLALQQNAEMQARSVETEVSDIGNAQVVSAAISPAEDAKSVSAGVQKALQDAKSAGNELFQRSDRNMDADTASSLQQTLSGMREDPPPPVERVQPEQDENIPTVQAEAEGVVPDAPEARREADQQVPGVESIRAEAEAKEMALAAVRGEISGGIETPLGAGVVVQTQPEMPQSRWSDVTEELVIPGPAPLTAESVSLAFERDGRRYDNGFPLY